MMNTRILLCGRESAGRTHLLRAVTPKGTVPDAPMAAQSVIYETDSADYINCTELPRHGEDYLARINTALRMNLAIDSPDTMDILWYCVGAETTREELRFLTGVKGRFILVLTENAELETEAQVPAIAEFIKLGIPQDRLVVVSLEKKTGLATLVNRTLKLLGKKDDVAEEALRYVWRQSESESAESYIRWAAGRAFAIAVIPLPLADVAPLVANEAYMFYRLGALYGYAVNETVLAGFLGCLGASVGGKLLASFIPFLKAPIAAGITYGVGKAAKAYFESGMTLKDSELKKIFDEAREDAKGIDWK